MKRKIPATMVSQHPDHAGVPYWHTTAFIQTQFETKECFLSFSELGASEYMWDWEGKLVDESVMERLLSEHFAYFKDVQVGRDKFLTFRLPNPVVETEFRLGRTFMGLLSAATMAKQIGIHSPPLFEVILPMTKSPELMMDVQEAFTEVANLKHFLFRFDSESLKYIQLIPLFEDIETIATSDDILRDYLRRHLKIFGEKPLYLRPFLARSDPALNSGIVPTVLAIKIALSRYRKLEKETKVKLYPILGCASLPFRGGLTPQTVDQFVKEYQGIRTAVVQSAFRYDYDKDEVISAIAKLEKYLPLGKTAIVTSSDEKTLTHLSSKFAGFYASTVEQIAETINAVAKYMPKRRERVLHIGLFGYSRGIGKVKLPRAISFTGALYSLGIPPELIGTGRGLALAKKTKNLKLLEKYYLLLRDDLIRAGRFLNKDVLKKLAGENASWKKIAEDIVAIESYIGKPLGPVTVGDKQHKKVTDKIYKKFVKGESLTKLIEEGARLRKSLG
ncbi:MAG: phosphoenolpyruvate carboxylase [bacterium]|nr:phosphoenolpyruvate carboxylase [bacterium]